MTYQPNIQPLQPIPQQQNYSLYSFLTPSIITKFSSDKLMLYPNSKTAVNTILQSVNSYEYLNELNEKTLKQHHEILGMLNGLIQVKIKSIETKAKFLQEINNKIDKLYEIRKTLIKNRNKLFEEKYPDYNKQVEERLEIKKEIEQENKLKNQNEINHIQQIQYETYKSTTSRGIYTINDDNPIDIIQYEKETIRITNEEIIEKRRKKQEELERKRIEIQYQRFEEEKERQKRKEENERKEQEEKLRLEQEKERKEREEKEKEDERIRQLQTELMKQPFEKKTMDEIEKGFENYTYTCEEFMNYCRLLLRDHIPFISSKMLYFFNEIDGIETSFPLFDCIKEKSNILIIIRTTTEVFCIHITDTVPNKIPTKRKSNDPIFWEVNEMYMYVIYHDKELFSPPKRIHNWKNKPKKVETIRFDYSHACMTFKDVFEISLDYGTGGRPNIKFIHNDILYDDNDNKFSFENQTKTVSVQQIIACQLTN